MYNGSQIRDWCRDGDLVTYVTGEFDIITIMGDMNILTLYHGDSFIFYETHNIYCMINRGFARVIKREGKVCM